MEPFRLEDWYTPTQAAERLTANCGRTIDISYVRTLARYKKVRAYEISERMRLYRKEDIDAYIVEARGVKSARAKRQQAQEKKRGKKTSDDGMMHTRACSVA